MKLWNISFLVLDFSKIRCFQMLYHHRDQKNLRNFHTESIFFQQHAFFMKIILFLIILDTEETVGTQGRKGVVTNINQYTVLTNFTIPVYSLEVSSIINSKFLILHFVLNLLVVLIFLCAPFGITFFFLLFFSLIQLPRTFFSSNPWSVVQASISSYIFL